MREGEIDLVVQKRELLMFVEVKTRSRDWERSAWAADWRGKNLRMRRAIRRFLLQHEDLEFSEYRVEIVFVTQGRVTARFEGE